MIQRIVFATENRKVDAVEAICSTKVDIIERNLFECGRRLIFITSECCGKTELRLESL